MGLAQGMRAGHYMLSWMGGQILVEVCLKQLKKKVILPKNIIFSNKRCYQFQVEKTQPLHSQWHFHEMRDRSWIGKPSPHHGPSSRKNWQILRASHTWTKEDREFHFVFGWCIWSVWFYSPFIPSPAKPAEHNTWSSDQAYIALPHIHWTPGMMENGIEGTHNYTIIMLDLCC